MLKKRSYKDMGNSNVGWLKSIFHFTFADYYNPLNINFGVLRVLNDDLIEANTGFETHPHKDMEIISYVIDGELTHGDSLNNKSTLQRGHVQYMSAGTGVEHSEFNLGDGWGRFLQIWIFPDRRGHIPNYGEFRFEWDLRQNKWFHIVSSIGGSAPIQIHQDANIYVLELNENETISFPLKEKRQAYLVQIEGASTINELQLEARDAVEISKEDISITALEKSHFILIEMAK
jgi:redox-sensitive bicupin YhaK (pirin superfamily)